jgi:hypothetical protein
MDVQEQLQAYMTQIVALGQAALARQRRGETLPDELSGPAEALLALERGLGGAAAMIDTAANEGEDLVAVALQEPAAPEEVTPPGDEEPAQEPDAAAGELDLVPEAPATAEPASPDVAAMSPVEAADWLNSLDEDAPSGMLIITDEVDATAQEPLVIDVDEEPGGGPMAIGAPIEAPPPPPRDPVHHVEQEEPAHEEQENATADTSDESEVDAPVATATPDEPDAPAPEPTAELRFCTNCGAELRPGRRFCHRCGASVAEMVSELMPPAPPASGAIAPDDIALPPREATPQGTPLFSSGHEEWPTFISSAPQQDASRYDAPPPPMARFCNNCGLGLDADTTICPDCGSRDIS